MIHFSNNLKFLRSQKGLKQIELAKKLGVKTNTISNYENGISQPDFKILDKIVQIFDIHSSDLLFKDLSISDYETKYKENKDATNILSEPLQENEYSSPMNYCKNCADKERIIKALQLTIDELRNDKAYLKGEIGELKEKLK